MNNDHKYSLTRVCLRFGQMNLPQNMLEFFPNEGDIRALDASRGSEFELNMQGPRIVTGLQDFYKSHHLEVNDQVLIRRLEDGRFALTPLPRPKKAGGPKSMPVERLVERLIEMGTPLSEPEIRAAFPELPRDLNLAEFLGRDRRLIKKEGRWRRTQPQHEEAFETMQDARAQVTEVRRERSEVQEGAAPRTGPSEEAAGGRAPENRAPEKPRRATVTPYPRGVMFPGDAGLNSAQEEPADPSLQARAREFLQGFGFRVEGLSHGQLIAKADMGRSQYSVLVHPHPEDARLDWAALLARKRETNAGYLAVFGAHRDLLRLHSPADLARASLWSWEALTRVQDLIRTVPVGPFDLESHFQLDGLFETGLERFEKTVSKRIAERGSFSAALSRLAAMKAPAVFLLEDVVTEDELSREQALKVLDLLSQAPFHMVAKVDSGEYCLRFNVSQGLLHLSEYALSLRERFPSRRTERLAGTADEDARAAAEQVAAVPTEAK